MITILYLLVALAILYLALRLFERGAVKAWQAWRERARGRGREEQVTVFHPDPDDQPRRPRPNLKRETPSEEAPPESEA